MMIPLGATVWQSMDSSLNWIGTMICFGGLIMLIVVSVACTRLGKILWALRYTNELLKAKLAADASSEASRKLEVPPLPVGMTDKKDGGHRPPPVPQPDVYRI